MAALRARISLFDSGPPRSSSRSLSRQYVTLGTAEAGWTRKKAQAELEDVLAKVKLGIWKPPEPEPAPEIDHDPTFHEFSSDWFEASKGEWRETTRLDYEWQLAPPAEVLPQPPALADHDRRG